MESGESNLHQLTESSEILLMNLNLKIAGENQNEVASLEKSERPLKTILGFHFSILSSVKLSHNLWENVETFE